MNFNHYPNDAERIRESYIDSARECFASPYRGRLNDDQIADLLSETMENLPPMEREAFAEMSMRNNAEFWPALISLVAPLVKDVIPKLVGGLIKPKTPKRKPSAVQSPEPVASEPVANQIAAILSNPQLLQALKQALGSPGSGSPPLPPSNVNAPVQAVNVNAKPQESDSYYYNDNYADDDSEAWRPGHWYYDRYGKRRWRPGYHYHPSIRRPIVRPRAPAYSPRVVQSPAYPPPAAPPPAAPPPEPTTNTASSQLMAMLNNPQAMPGQAHGDTGYINDPMPTGSDYEEPQEAFYYNDADSYDDDSLESFWGNVVRVGAPLLGGAIGGPIGTLAGGFAGNRLGQQIRRPRPPQGRAPMYPPPRFGWPRRPANYPPRFGWGPRAAPYPPNVDVRPPSVAQPVAPGGYPPNDPAPPTGQPVAPGNPPYDPAPTGQPPAAPSLEPTSNSAASQLLALINNPQFSQAMLGQVMGDVGSGSATVQQDNGMVDIPFGALMNTLTELGQQAAEESVRMGDQESERYLMDSEGNYRVDDPSNPEQRASAVMDLFREDFEYRTRNAEASQEAIEALEASKSYDPVTEWLLSAGMVR